MNPKIATALGAVALAAAMFVGGALVPMRAERSDAEPAPPALTATDTLIPTTAGPDDAIEALAARIEERSDDAKLHAQLGLAYLQKARDEADPSVLPLADAALNRSLDLQPEANLEAYVGMASLANARHDFSHSVRWSRRAIDTNPYNAAAYGLLGDALFELGRVRAADASYQQMVEVRPDVASYVRASYALQYHGRTRAAIDAMRLALQAAGPTGQIAAWVRHQMGDIYAGLRDYDQSARQNRIGKSIAPGYVPPTVGLAESYIAQGRLEDAIPIMQEAVAGLPSLEYMITLGELYEATGRPTEAEAQYEAVARKLAEYRAAGVLTDADFTVFYADRGLRLDLALAEARRAYDERPTQKMADALAWVLHANGQDRAAWRYAREAARGPVPDAMTLFHAGEIARALGDDDRAVALMRRALKLDPTFSVVKAPIARRIVQTAAR